MKINYDQIEKIEKNLLNYENCKLQIVTKNRNIEIIKELIENGYCYFGENKVQEASKKFKQLNHNNFKLDLIGPLQTNKVKQALELFDTIQTIDRPKLVNEIIKIKNINTIKTKDFFIQVNIGNESQKSGVLPQYLTELYNLCLNSDLNITGLMCIPPLDDNPNFYFKQIKTLRDKLNNQLKLSMGMSNDYEIALNYGSNIIRIGSLLFSND